MDAIVEVVVVVVDDVDDCFMDAVPAYEIDQECRVPMGVKYFGSGPQLKPLCCKDPISNIRDHENISISLTIVIGCNL